MLTKAASQVAHGLPMLTASPEAQGVAELVQVQLPVLVHQSAGPLPQVAQQASPAFGQGMQLHALQPPQLGGGPCSGFGFARSGVGFGCSTFGFARSRGALRSGAGGPSAPGRG